MKKQILHMGLVAAALTLTASAFAGEVNGRGDSTAIRSLNGDLSAGLDGLVTSICAYSGLEDNSDSRVQNPHYDANDGGVLPAGVAQICSLLNYGRKHLFGG